MSSVRNHVAQSIQDVWSSSGQQVLTIEDASTLGDDLKLSSLDVAQLVVQLEQELGVDPFRAGTAPVQTFGELVAVYERATDGAC